MRTTAAIVLLWASVAAAEPGELVNTSPQYLILRPDKAIVIDGHLTEWDMARSPFTISADGKNPLNRVYSNEPTNPVKGDADLSGRAAVAWDETHFYVAGQMVDDHLLGVKPDSAGNQGPPGWGCDSLMVMVHSFRQPMKTNSPYSPTPFLGLRYAPTGEKPRGALLPSPSGELDKRDRYWVLTANSKWAVTETPEGYTVEAAIPWKDLEFIAKAGERLFVSFLAADMDPGEALNQVGWGYSGQPKECPVFRLADRSDFTGIVTVSAEEVPANSGWMARAEVDAFRAGVRVETLRIIDKAGQTAIERPIAQDVPAGKTRIEFFDFAPGDLAQPGAFSIELVASTDGQKATAAVAGIRIVEPKPPPPLIQNLPGEIRHMAPDRTSLHAWWEHRGAICRHHFVIGKQDYVPYIRRHVEPNLKETIRNYLKQDSTWGFTLAPRAMAMHQITGDQEYVGLAKDITSQALDQMKKDLHWFKFTALTRYRYLTWKQRPDSPFAPEQAEERYRVVLHTLAENPPKEYFAESGSHNRVWARYAILKIARLAAEEDKKPVDPRVQEYTDYHDKLIGEVGDADDASAGYHWVFWDFASTLFFYTGDWDSFLKNRGYVKTLRRYVEMVSPSGACPQFQSCSGWHEVGASMWAYEWMSKLTRDGRFRWTSHRIAEYYYNHLDYRAAQYHGPYDTARDNFVLAYLLTDETVPAVPPASGSRVTWRHPFVPVPIERQRARPGTAAMGMGSDRWIPDKAVLSSGSDAQAMWALVELLPVAGHGGEIPGNLIALMIHDTALLAGQGYYENTPDYQNLMWVEDLDGLASDPREPTTEVPVFVDDPGFTFVRIRTSPYQRLPIVHTRDLLFVKNAFLVVKDRVRFESSMKVRLGPCYQTRCLGPQCGDHWFNTYYDQLYYTGLGLGRGVQAIQNPAWDLLVYFTPRPGRSHTVSDRYIENPFRTSPVQMRQTWSGMARAGQEITFTSVLLPHVPTLTPKDLIDPPQDSKEPRWIEVPSDDDSLTVIKAIGEMDPVNRTRYETWVLLNEAGKVAGAGPIESDGLVAVIGHNHDGRIQHRAIVGGQKLVYRGLDESAAARKHEASPLRVPPEYAP